MEAFLVNVQAIRHDEKYNVLSPVGRLLFIQASVAFDPNWGHAEYTESGLVAQAFPHEQALADSGCDEAGAFINEAREQLRLALEIGLFIVEETRLGTIIAYANWERYNDSRTQRGTPKFPMGPQIAATRNWNALSVKCTNALERWRLKCGLTGDETISEEGSRSRDGDVLSAGKNVLRMSENILASRVGLGPKEESFSTSTNPPPETEPSAEARASEPITPDPSLRTTPITDMTLSKADVEDLLAIGRITEFAGEAQHITDAVRECTSQAMRHDQAARRRIVLAHVNSKDDSQARITARSIANALLCEDRRLMVQQQPRASPTTGGRRRGLPDPADHARFEGMEGDHEAQR